MKKMNKWHKLCAFMLLITLCTALMTPSALADTDGTELQVTAQPDKLVVELGSDWAGAEFELRTDVGLFPVPVVVSETGVLSMELGGSSTYTLTRISETPVLEAPAPDTPPDAIAPVPPDVTVPGAPETTAPAEPDSTEDPAESDPPASEDEDGGIPTMHLIIFFGGLAVAIGGLITMYIIKRRNAYYDDDEDYYGEDEQ